MRGLQYLWFGLACTWSCTFTLGLWPHTVAAKQTILSELDVLEQVEIKVGSQKNGINWDLASELRRYPFETSILRELQLRHTDIWRVTPEAIDVYLSRNAIEGSSLLQHSNYTVLPFTIPESQFPSIDVDDEDPDALEPEELADLHDFDDLGNSRFSKDFKSKPKPYFNLTYLSHDFHSQYHPASNVTVFLRSLAQTFPKYVTLNHVGHSYLGRRILAVKISSPEPVRVGQKPRKGFVILGAQHAREWIATSASLYLAHALAVDPAEQSSDDAKFSLRQLLDHFDFHIIPLPNPDGHQYTRKKDRLWYKNRQPVSAGGDDICKGLDMNRNWGYEWLPSQDPSSDPCAHWFPGTRPFEAHEVNALASYFMHQMGGTDNVKAFFDIRSYGQMISAPFSYNCDVLPRDAEDLIEAALGAAQAASRVHKMTFSTGRLCETLYSAPGNVVDWAYVIRGIKYVYAAHLRDTGTYGFLIPENWIRPTGEETAAMVNYLAMFMTAPPK